jgi:organic hydroperoxide reductase OsmC/OhrA
VARRFEYAISLDRGGRLLAEDGTALEPGPAWTPEHLLLAGLARCTLKSLRFHAERAGLTVSGGADAAGVVTQREEDGRYALVEVQVGLDVRLDPLPASAALGELLALAERDCFVGASLRVTPLYVWRVNGELADR